MGKGLTYFCSMLCLEQIEYIFMSFMNFFKMLNAFFWKGNCFQREVLRCCIAASLINKINLIDGATMMVN